MVDYHDRSRQLLVVHAKQHTGNTFDALSLAVVAASQKYQSGTSRFKLGKQPGKVEIGCDDHPLLSNSGHDDEFIRRATHRQFTCMNGVVTERS